MAHPTIYEYTTRHELDFLDYLFRSGKIGYLRKLRAIYGLRTWGGQGMSVSRLAVEDRFNLLLGRQDRLGLQVHNLHNPANTEPPSTGPVCLPVGAHRDLLG